MCKKYSSDHKTGKTLQKTLVDPQSMITLKVYSNRILIDLLGKNKIKSGNKADLDSLSVEKRRTNNQKKKEGGKEEGQRGRNKETVKVVSLTSLIFCLEVILLKFYSMITPSFPLFLHSSFSHLICLIFSLFNQII